MEMLLGNNVIRAALRSDLADSGPAGMEMHVAMANPISPPDKAGRVRCRATTEAWDALLRWCQTNSRTVVGATQSERAVAAAAQRTKARIQREFDRLAKHPGYVGKAKVGVDTTVLPARRCGGGRWWPTRRMALEHSDGTTTKVEVLMLEPETVTRNGRVFTVWETVHPQFVPEVPPGIWD